MRFVLSPNPPESRRNRVTIGPMLDTLSEDKELTYYTHGTTQGMLHMTPRRLGLITAFALLTPMSALAGQPGTPGQQGEIVNRDKAHWQNAMGEENAWGQTVSGVATDQEGGNNETSLGNYLSYMAGGPNPFSDQGAGND